MLYQVSDTAVAPDSVPDFVPGVVPDPVPNTASDIAPYSGTLTL